MAKKIKRKKLPKIRVLKQKLWEVFSKYIKVRDKYICITCGQYNTGSGIHAGHFIPSKKGGIALKYNETNVHTQCYNCNVNLGGYGAMYSIKIREKYGVDYDVLLIQLIKPGVEYNREEYLSLIDKYTNKLNELEATK
jgi:septum formation topological specificity factor MinE